MIAGEQMRFPWTPAWPTEMILATSNRIGIYADVTMSRAWVSIIHHFSSAYAKQT
jgi:hypothetical protein